MSRYWTLVAAMGAVFVALFVVVEAFEIAVLTDPMPWMRAGGPLAALLGFTLLVGDVLLPVPSSLVMIAHGAIFGVVPGTLLSLAGGVGASVFGFILGRWGRERIARWVPAEERRRAEILLSEWGDLAVIVTRPVPIVAESVAILAGASSLGIGRFVLAAAAGTLPASLLYGLTGAVAAGLDSSVLIFALVLAIAGLFWLLGRRWVPRTRRSAQA